MAKKNKKATIGPKTLKQHIQAEIARAVKASRVSRKKPSAPRVNVPRSMPMVRHYRQSPIHDVTKRRYINCVADPFGGALSKGISGNHPTTETAVVRRKVKVSVDFAAAGAFASGTVKVGGGVDIFVPSTAKYAPYLACVSSNDSWATMWRSNFGKETAPLLPDNAIARVVSQGIRITPTSSVTTVGGVFSFFRCPPAAANELITTAPDPTQGSLRNELSEAIAEAPVRAGKTITFIYPPDDQWFVVNNTEADVAASGAAAASGTWLYGSANLGGMRLWFNGPAQTFMFEITQVLEYYIDTHKSSCTATITHPDGPAIVNRVQTALLSSGDNRAVVESHGSTNKVADFLNRVTADFEAGGKAVVTGAQAVYNGLKAGKYVKDAYTAFSEGEGLSMLALTAV